MKGYLYFYLNSYSELSGGVYFLKKSFFSESNSPYRYHICGGIGMRYLYTSPNTYFKED